MLITKSILRSLFNNKVKIYSITEVSGAMGGNVETSELKATKRCRIRALTGKEKEELLGQQGLLATKRVYLEPTSLEEKDYMIISDIPYDISFVDNKHEMGHHLEVNVIERK